MHLIYIKYMQVLCITIYFTKNPNCDQLMLQTPKDEQQLIRHVGCIASCLEQAQNLTFHLCHNQCFRNDDVLDKNAITRKILQSYGLELHCGGESRLAINVYSNETNVPDYNNNYSNDQSFTSTHWSMDLGNFTQSTMDESNRRNVYIFKIHKDEPDNGEREIYLSDTPLIEFDNLTANHDYTVWAAIVNSNQEVVYVQEPMSFRTMGSETYLGSVTDIQIVKFTQNLTSPWSVDAILTWKPAEDKACQYTILYYQSKVAGASLEIIELDKPNIHYEYKLYNLTLETDYFVEMHTAIARKTSNGSKTSSLIFTTPSCLDWFNNSLDFCAPKEPTNVQASKIERDENIYDINISWERPELLPDFYLIHIYDLFNATNPISETINVTGDCTSVLLEGIVLNGIVSEASMYAISKGGKSPRQFIYFTSEKESISDELGVSKVILIVFLTLIICATAACVIVWISRYFAKIKRSEEWRKYFQDLEKKAPIDPNENVDLKSRNLNFSKKAVMFVELDWTVLREDPMEVDINQLSLHNVLGEGAFGIVRKGLYQLGDGIQKEVAVKMLKDYTNDLHINEFKREIEVMKAVGAHPHIVGIVGHCTRTVERLLLLTEYCSRGNLLSFLRSEWERWTHRQQIVDDGKSLTPALFGHKSPEHMFNFDSSFVDKAATNYKNLHSPDDTISPQTPEDDNNSVCLNKSPSNLIINKLYDEYNRPLSSLSVCPHSCRNQVEILSNNSVLANATVDQSLADGTRKCRIKISECECCRLNCVSAIQNKSYDYNIPTDDTIIGDDQNVCTPNKPIDDHEFLTSNDLLSFSKQISLGMEFLVRNKVVHRDLAARNVLVYGDRTMKISDFGLSRDIYQENMYKKTGNGKLPIKWLAIESMTHQVYNSQSDVWSFGILLYEIVTLGGTPYPSIPASRLLKLLKSGYRMEMPKNCGEQIYNLMYSCWNSNSQERPSFVEITRRLDQFLLNPQPGDDEIIKMNSDNTENIRLKSSLDDSYLKPI